MSAAASYIEPLSGTRYPIDVPRWRADNRRPLLVTPGNGLSPDDIERSLRSIWRYRAGFPVDVHHPISMGEGCTPLVERPWGNQRTHFKLEWFNPTGSFKDRGTSVMLSTLRQLGISAVLEDSSGNGASSIAGYGAAGGMGVKIFAQKSTQPTRIAEANAYGAEVELVAGSRDEAEREAIRQSVRTFYAGHTWQPLFIEGMKSLAFELWEDLGFRGPDNIVLPVGAGSSLLGCFFGFSELLRAGQIARLPRLFAVQPQNCSPLDASFTAGLDTPVHREVAPTIAEASAISRPRRLREMVAALRDSRGRTVAVSEREIVAALRDLTMNGLYAEPTSAAAAAGLARLVEAGTIKPRETTVVLLTGTGLKAAATISDITRTIPVPTRASAAMRADMVDEYT